MLVLVTGSTGFIGSHLCRALLEDGHHVRAFHRTQSPLLALQDLPVEHVIGDISHPDSLKRAMPGVQAVFHTAAMLGKPPHPEDMYRITVEGTRNVLAAAMEANVQRLVHTSSVAALGVPLFQAQAITNSRSFKHHPLPRLINENHTWNFSPDRWRYGYAKYLAELEVQSAVAKGLDALILNPSLVMGAGDLNRISGNLIIHTAQHGIPVATPGGLNVVHIGVVVQGHLSALVRGRTGERYILGGENLSHLRFLELIAEVVGVPLPRWSIPTGILRALAGPVSAIDRRFSLPFSGEILYKAGYYFYYNISKAQQELGIKYPHPIKDAISESYAWYRQQGIIP